MVFEEIVGVVKLVPVARDEPPVLALYQFMVPPFVVAVRPVVPEPQIAPPVAVLITGGN